MLIRSRPRVMQVRPVDAAAPPADERAPPERARLPQLPKVGAAINEDLEVATGIAKWSALLVIGPEVSGLCRQILNETSPELRQRSLIGTFTGAPSTMREGCSPVLQV